MATQDITTIGAVFSRLKVLGLPFKRKDNGRWYVECLCVCGNKKHVMCKLLVNEHVKSCGCLNSETARKNGISTRTHGKTHGREWKTYYGMLDRRYKSEHQAYKRYGGRGITVCDEWLESFEKFLSDMGCKPDGMTLDRINNDKGYSKDNCKWATMKEQCNNRCSNVIIKAFGLNLTAAQWSDKLNIPGQVLYRRISKGWEEEKALTTKYRHRTSKIQS